MTRSIFHYTTIEGLLGIVGSRCLFATHYDYLNDVSEVKVIREHLTPLFESEFAELATSLIKSGLLRREVYAEFGQSLHQKEAERVFEIVLRVTNKTTPFFITSFCEHRENTEEYHNGLLSQWRAYGRTGGFAIEFDESKICELIPLEQKKYAYSGILAHEVYYEEHDKRIDRQKFSGIAKALFRELFAKQGIDITPIAGDKNIHDLYEPFIEVAPFLKDRSFSEEAEYRIVAICFRPTSRNKSEKRNTKVIRARNRNGLITPYIELFSGLGAKLPIKSIVVGPHRYQIAQQHAVEIVLEQSRLDVPVRRSSIPFRD